MQVVAFVSGKGGVGKTTLSANVAAMLPQLNKRVLAIDLDPQNALRLHLGMDPSDTAGLANEGLREESAYDSSFGPRFFPFGVLAPSDLTEFSRFLREHPHWLRRSIEALSGETFDVVVIDTPPGPSVFLDQALDAADLAVVVLAADAASLATLTQIQDLVADAQVGRAQPLALRYVLNQVRPGSTLSDHVQQALGAQLAGALAPTGVRRHVDASHALAHERVVFDYQAQGALTSDLLELTRWLDDTLRTVGTPS